MNDIKKPVEKDAPTLSEAEALYDATRDALQDEIDSSEQDAERDIYE